MSYAILCLALLALFHFVYESILAPSFRMKLRFDLGALQREVRRLPGHNPSNGEVIRSLDESLVALIRVLHRFDAATLIAIDRETRGNARLRRQLESRLQALDACDVPGVQDIRRRIVRIATRALVVNHGACCVYVIPVAVACFGLTKVKGLIKASTSLSATDLSRMAPGNGQQPHYSRQARG